MFNEQELKKPAHAGHRGYEIFELSHADFYTYEQYITRARFWDRDGYMSQSSLPLLPIRSEVVYDSSVVYTVSIRVIAEEPDGRYLWLTRGVGGGLHEQGFAAGLLRKVAVATGVTGLPLTEESGSSDLIQASRWFDRTVHIDYACKLVPPKGVVLIDVSPNDNDCAEVRPPVLLAVAPSGYMNHRSPKIYAY